MAVAQDADHLLHAEADDLFVNIKKGNAYLRMCSLFTFIRTESMKIIHDILKIQDNAGSGVSGNGYYPASCLKTCYNVKHIGCLACFLFFKQSVMIKACSTDEYAYA